VLARLEWLGDVLRSRHVGPMQPAWRPVINVGDRITVRVTRIEPHGFYAFIEDMDVLVPISELTWNSWLEPKIRHPEDLVRVGDDVEVAILSIRDKHVVASVKRCHPEKNPWRESYVIGARFTGVVDSEVAFGHFIRLPNGAMALLPKASSGRDLKAGERIVVVVTECDPMLERLEVGLP
jgi:small subunit ribosomal protein S1